MVAHQVLAGQDSRRPPAGPAAPRPAPGRPRSKFMSSTTKRAAPAASQQTTQQQKKAKAAAVAVVVHDQAPSASSRQTSSDTDVNMTYNAKLEQMLGAVIEAFPGIQAKHPLSVKDGGVQEPMTQAVLAHGMKGDRGVVEGAGSLFWHDVRGRPQPNVPINVQGIEDIKQHSFMSPPARVTFSVHVAIDATATLADTKGKLQRISPEEPVHALLWGIHAAIERNAGADEMARWEALLLSIPYVFERLSNRDAILRRSINIREEMTALFDACARTAFARFAEDSFYTPLFSSQL